eukprot:GEMP01012810.1.p1 GENE.GEMP01012810.1~~GEMP01012810.1.p1  ORF type:complete len:625 (+),score=132.32 GEMP01012810.1:75-1949(+)
MDKISLPVRLKALDRGEKTLDLCLTMKRETSPTLHQLLHIEITDETDAFFLFTLTLGESDFHALKSEQRLLVDFQTFPEKFLEMLQDVPERLYAALVMQNNQEAHFSLVESNQFRELPHLCLKFRKGNDEALKEYMSSKLTEFKTNNEILTTRAAQAEEDNMRVRQRCGEYEETVRRLTVDQQTLAGTLQSKHTIELGELKEAHALRLEKVQRKSQEERLELEGMLRTKIDELTGKVSKYETELLAVTQEKCQLETAESRNRDLIVSQTAELSASEAEVLQLRTECKSLESNKYGLEKQITELEWNVRSLNERLSDKENYSQNQVALTEQTQAKSTSMEETLNVYKQQSQQLEEKFQHSVTEIEKGNSIIQKLHSQIKNFKTKLRLKDLTLIEQEKNMGAVEKELLGEKKQEDVLNMQLNETKSREEKLRREFESLKSNLSEAHDMIKNNQQVIDYLNKQLTERDLKTFAPLQMSASPVSAFAPSSGFASATPQGNTLASTLPSGLHNTISCSNPIQFGTADAYKANQTMPSSLRGDKNDIAARNARVAALLAERGLGAMPAITSSTPMTSKQLQDFAAPARALSPTLPTHGLSTTFEAFAPSKLAPHVAAKGVEHIRYRPVAT